MRINTTVSLLLLSFSAAVMAEQSASPGTEPSVQAPEHLQKTCLKETGSRIPQHHDDDCVNAHGTIYSRNDLESGGVTLVGDGLWRLDPALTVSGRHR